MMLRGNAHVASPAMNSTLSSSTATATATSTSTLMVPSSRGNDVELGDHAVKGVLIQPVDQTDLMEALNSLLSRVGLPPSIEENQLLTRIVDLENSNRRLQASVTEEGRLLGEARKCLSDEKNSHRCSICEAEVVSHVLVPCGHVVCRSCVDRLVDHRCPFCRKLIEHKIRFYMPGCE